MRCSSFGIKVYSKPTISSLAIILTMTFHRVARGSLLLYPCLVSLLLVWSARGETTGCSHIVPGLDRIAHGVDITRLDLFHDYAAGPDDGFVSRILELHCDSDKSWTSPITGVTYQVPDEVSDVIGMRSGMAISDSLLAKTVTELRRSLLADISFNDSFGLGSLSESTTVTKSKDRLQRMNKFVAFDRAYVSILTLRWKSELERTSLSPYFMFDLDDLPETFDDSTAERYLKIFPTYGTHYFRRGIFGASLSTWFEIDRNIIPLLELTDAEIREQVTAYFLFYLKENGAYSGKVPFFNYKFGSYIHYVYRLFGGKPDLFLKKFGYEKWYKSLASNPWLHSGTLDPITDLIPENHPRKVEVIKALQAYEDRSALPEIVNLVDTYLEHHLLNSSAFLRDIKQKAEDIMKHKVVPEAGIARQLESQIKDYLTTPSWFQETQLCFRYETRDEVCHEIGETPKFVDERSRDPLQDCIGLMPKRQAVGLDGIIYFKTASSVAQDLLDKWQANFTLSHSVRDYKVCITIS